LSKDDELDVQLRFNQVIDESENTDEILFFVVENLCRIVSNTFAVGEATNIDGLVEMIKNLPAKHCHFVVLQVLLVLLTEWKKLLPLFLHLPLDRVSILMKPVNHQLQLHNYWKRRLMSKMQ
jgi:hypothetical protein